MVQGPLQFWRRALDHLPWHSWLWWALSGVTTIAIVIWLVLWGVLEWRWSKKSVPLGTISVTAIVLLVLSFLLTFPPIVDIF
jgi:hypothetical protein